MRPGRLCHHLARLEAGQLIRTAGYRPLAAGKAGRIRAACATEPPRDDARPADVALVLNVALATARAGVNAAARASEAGGHRRITWRLGELTAASEGLLRTARDHPDGDGGWTTVRWMAIDRQDRRAAPSPPPTPRRPAPAGQQNTGVVTERHAGAGRVTAAAPPVLRDRPPRGSADAGPGGYWLGCGSAQETLGFAPT